MRARPEKQKLSPGKVSLARLSFSEAHYHTWQMLTRTRTDAGKMKNRKLCGASDLASKVISENQNRFERWSKKP